MERVVTLLLSEELKRLDMNDFLTLQALLSPATKPPVAPNIDVADDWAGRTIEFERVLTRILDAALEIAAQREEGQTAPK